MISIKERQRIWREMVEEEGELLLTKGSDYTAGKGESDAYANFHIISDLLLGASWTPFTVTMVYFLKHVLSILAFAKTGKQESSESLRGRFMDIRNYAFILSQLADAHEKEVRTVPVWGGTLPASELYVEDNMSTTFSCPTETGDCICCDLAGSCNRKEVSTPEEFREEESLYETAPEEDPDWTFMFENGEWVIHRRDRR